MTSAEEFVKCKCGECGGHFEVPLGYLGDSQRCPHCQNLVLIEQAYPVPKPPEKTPVASLGPVQPLRIGRAMPPRIGTLTILFAATGLGMMGSGFTSSDEAKTVFQQIAAYMLAVGGILLCAIAAAIQAIKPFLRYLWEIALRLESIEQRLAERNASKRQ